MGWGRLRPCLLIPLRLRRARKEESPGALKRIALKGGEIRDEQGRRRRYTRQCLELASTFQDKEARATLLGFAQAWSHLAILPTGRSRK